MSIKLSDSIRVGQQKPLEDKYFNELVPYTSTTQVNTLLPKAVRHIGLTVNINGEEYWYKDGIEDSNLVLKVNNIDTSNLVPYTGATQDVNIGANYFESSAGFKTPNGTPNKALTSDGGTFDLTTKADLVNNKVPSSQLPSYVDDVVEGTNLAALPITGETGKIYIALDTNKTYRWSGSTYVEITASPSSTDSVVEGTTNLYFTAARAQSAVTTITGNAGTATKLQTARTISVTGDGTGNTTFDGSNNSSITLTLANSGVNAGTYGSSSTIPVVTVDTKGRVTGVTTQTIAAGSSTLAALADVTLTSANSGQLLSYNGSKWVNTTPNYLTTNQTITVTGDATGSGATSLTLTLANSGVTSGTYKSVTVDAKGRVTAGSNPTTLSGYGITDAVSSSLLGANSGVATLDSTGRVPATQLPSYVDDVLEFANLASFPATGESGKIYIAIDTNLTYRWGGSSYVVMSSSLALGETESTAYRGDRGKIAYDHSQTIGNPHNTTKSDIGLGNVDNTSDINKPISKAAQTALDLKLDKGTYTGTASDLKSLIDTKADLDGGKVPKAQSQPSTMVMDSSTYVITFTDATGAVQTIDLPLESLFKDANYNSSTKSLIVTLQDGTTRTIPLTDLVDLPEIVLATTNPAVTPTSGQKVYFNTSLGKVWFNVGGNWVFGGNLISDSEKANITTAYYHSQATGNAHGTNLEQLSDVSGDATSIVDTDTILKKESGGLWKKITFANFKNWFTTELAKKINIGLDTVFNFKNISAMTLTQFKALTPNLETIYFTEEQNATGWQQIKYNGLGISIPATTETKVSITDENYIELDSDSSFNLIDVANTKINGIFEKDFVIIKFNAGVVTPATANQWFKVILKINGVQVAVSPVFYLTETSGTVEQIAHNFSLNVPAEMVTNGATLHLKTSATMTFNNPSISVVRVHKSTNANL